MVESKFWLQNRDGRPCFVWKRLQDRLNRVILNYCHLWTPFCSKIEAAHEVAMEQCVKSIYMVPGISVPNCLYHVLRLFFFFRVPLRKDPRAGIRTLDLDDTGPIPPLSKP